MFFNTLPENTTSSASIIPLPFNSFDNLIICESRDSLFLDIISSIPSTLVQSKKNVFLFNWFAKIRKKNFAAK